MPDGTTQTIDRLFDLVDLGVDHVVRILNRGKQIADRHGAPKRGRAKITNVSTSVRAQTPSKPPAPSTVTALTRRPRFYIVEAITLSGVTEFVVTDGGNARTACPSREVAEQILRALEKAP